MSGDDAPLLRGLPPLVGPGARILILGSFPSAASLAAQQYYAHPRNLFWRILGDLLGQPLPAMDYPRRCELVMAAGIAIWDLYATCRRDGSLDSAIRDGVPNDLARLQKSALAGRRSSAALAAMRICCNGRTAARHKRELIAQGFDLVELPSTSPANAGMPYAEKLERWRLGLAGYLTLGSPRG